MNRGEWSQQIWKSLSQTSEQKGLHWENKRYLLKHLDLHPKSLLFFVNCNKNALLRRKGGALDINVNPHASINTFSILKSVKGNHPSRNIEIHDMWRDWAPDRDLVEKQFSFIFWSKYSSEAYYLHFSKFLYRAKQRNSAFYLKRWLIGYSTYVASAEMALPLGNVSLLAQRYRPRSGGCSPHHRVGMLWCIHRWPVKQIKKTDASTWHGQRKNAAKMVILCCVHCKVIITASVKGALVPERMF